MLQNIKGNLFNFDMPKIMGILNITPDSFYDGGKYSDIKGALERVNAMLAEGADVIDIGGYSSRPGAGEVSVQEELDRLLPVIEQIVSNFPQAVISIDTFRAQVAAEAIRSGAHIINDIGGGNLDDQMFTTVAGLKVPYILMHSRGTPKTMQQQTGYNDLIKEILADLSEKVTLLRALDVKDIIIDPGFGFAKTLDQNYELLNRIDELKILDLPILGALSRKSMIYKLLEISPEEALNGTTVLNTLLLLKGVNIIRVHDVRAANEVRKLVQKNSMAEFSNI
ncbi:MAG TPA: dihydropteroate synthase [Pseudosphingobacterium sp.]|nr:dihydropteroate synthase [Pseudosphingobacterium sp.]